MQHTFHISHHKAPCKKLLKKNWTFYRDDNKNTVFQKLKSFIPQAHSTPFQHYERDLPMTIQADTTKNYLGNCKLQHNNPVAKSAFETLAIIYAFEHSHPYYYGCSFTTETDRKPLMMIALKNLTAVPLHLQSMLLYLQQYYATIKYRHWSELQTLDALSRLSSLKQRYQIP